MSAIWNLIFKKENNTIFWSELSKLHKKDPIYVKNTFSLKQGETRTSSGPILHPLIHIAFKLSWHLINLVTKDTCVAVFLN